MGSSSSGRWKSWMSTISYRASFRRVAISCTHRATASALRPGRVLPTIIPIFSMTTLHHDRSAPTPERAPAYRAPRRPGTARVHARRARAGGEDREQATPDADVLQELNRLELGLGALVRPEVSAES